MLVGHNPSESAEVSWTVEPSGRVMLVTRPAQL